MSRAHLNIDSNISMKIFLLSLPLLAGLGLSAPATVLPVVNASFESPALAANDYTYTLTGGWAEQDGNGTSAFIERVPGFAAQGQNTLGMVPGPSSRQVYQDTSHFFQPNTVYTLTVAVGNRAGFTTAGNASTYELTSLVPGLAVGNEVDASILAAPGQFVDAPPISLNTALQPDLVGKAISIGLYARGNGRSHFDNIRLATTSMLVANSKNGGPGSLRNAFINASSGDTILFDPAVFDGGPEDVIVLASDLSMGDGRSLTIDATNIPGGVTISGGDVTRCFLRSGTGTLTLRGLTIAGARAGGSGGAIQAAGSATLHMQNCTLTGNISPGGYGGGLHVQDTAQAVLVNCTIAGNTASWGGGLSVFSTASLSLQHCTVTGNTGTNCCGGIVKRGALTLTNCIIAQNTGSAGSDINLEQGTLSLAGRNFIGNNATVESAFPAGNPNANGDRAGTSAAPLDPLLSAATFNGGTGMTRLPLPGSPVINNGLATADTPATDQRGAVRPQGSAPDMGAVEVEWGGNVATAPPRLTGLWLFDNSGDITQASVGTNLAVAGATPAWSTNQVDNDQRRLSGVISTVGGTANRLVATHGIAPNGGGTKVNRYTLLMDILSPPGSYSSFRSLLQTSTSNTNDTDYYISQTDTMGGGGLGFTPAIDESRWQRVVITVENGTSLRAYVNGALFYTHTVSAVDGAMSLEATALFFADNNGENAPLYVGAIAMWNGPLSAADVAALGGPGGSIPPDGQITTPVDEVTALPFAANPNPAEGVDKALDDLTNTKYLNIQKLNTGLEIVPALGVTRLTGLRLTSANDVPGRDPATFTVLGRIGDRPWVPIAAGTVPAFSGRFITQEFRFTSAPPACDRYQVLFPTVASASPDAMQIAEVDLLGAPVDRTMRVTKLAYRGVAGNQRQFTIVWAAEPYATYGLQSSPNLQQTWTLFGTGMTSSNAAGYQVFTSGIGNARGFFRVLRER